MRGRVMHQGDRNEQVCRPIRREQLRQLVPLADTTIWEMEQRGQFPKRFYLTERCAVWDANEVEEWLRARRDRDRVKPLGPDVKLRKARPVKRQDLRR